MNKIIILFFTINIIGCYNSLNYRDSNGKLIVMVSCDVNTKVWCLRDISKHCQYGYTIVSELENEKYHLLNMTVICKDLIIPNREQVDIDLKVRASKTNE